MGFQATDMTQNRGRKGMNYRDTRDTPKATLLDSIRFARRNHSHIWGKTLIVLEEVARGTIVRLLLCKHLYFFFLQKGTTDYIADDVFQANMAVPIVDRL